jgi:hypothetical protein
MRGDVTFSRSDFAYDPEGNAYVCPGGQELKKYNRVSSKPHHGLTKDARRRLARLSQNAGRTCQRARSRAPFMKPLATRRAQSSGPRLTSSHVGSERRSRCSLPSRSRCNVSCGGEVVSTFVWTKRSAMRPMAVLRPSTVRSAALRSRALSLAKRSRSD